MQHRIVKILLGSLLSIVLSFNLGLREIAHTFTHHQDTIDHVDANRHGERQGLSLDKLHHHCDYLTDILPPFLNADLAFSLDPLTEVSFEVFQASFYVYLKEGLCLHSFLRGPPMFS